GAFLVRLGPRAPAVVGAIDAALVGFDHREDAVGIGRRDRDAEASPRALGQAVPGQALPRVAAVRGLPETAARTAALEAPWRAIRLPRGGEEDPRILRIHAQIHRARAVVHEEHALPGRAAVPGAEHAALVIRPEGVAQRGDVGHVGIPRVDANPPDLARVLEA